MNPVDFSRDFLKSKQIWEKKDIRMNWENVSQYIWTYDQTHLRENVQLYREVRKTKLTISIQTSKCNSCSLFLKDNRIDKNFYTMIKDSFLVRMRIPHEKTVPVQNSNRSVRKISYARSLRWFYIAVYW